MKAIRKVLIFFAFLFFLGTVELVEAVPTLNIWQATIERPSGDIGFKFREDTFSGHSKNTEKQITKYRLLNEELNLKTKAFIYDPRFIELNISGGVILGQGQLEYQGGDLLTRFDISADILKENPYGGRMYFRKYDLDFQHSPSSQYLLHQTDFGMKVRLKDGVLKIPIPIKVDFLYSDKESENIFEFFKGDNSFDDFYKFRETTAMFKNESRKRWKDIDFFWQSFSKHVKRVDENRGREFVIDYNQRMLYLRALGRFGEDDRFRWKAKFNWRSQTDWPKYQYLDIGGEMKYKIFDKFSSSLDSIFNLDIAKHSRWFGSQFSDLKSEIQREDSIRFLGGLDYRLFQSLFSKFRLKYNKFFFTDYNQIEKELFLGTRYTKKIPGGNIFGNYSISPKTTERTGEKISFSSNEFHVISDYSSIVLDSENVIADSVVITDQSGEITYKPGLDYRIYQIGRQVYVERIPGSEMINGDTVLVDYRFSNPRGSLKELTQNFSLGLRWKFLSPYVRIIDRKQTLVDGDDLLLNPGRSTIYGLKLSHGFYNKKLTPELKIEKEKNIFIIDPFERTTVSGSLSYSFGGNMSVVSYFNKSLIDYSVGPNHDTTYSKMGLDILYDGRRARGSFSISKEFSQVGGSVRDTLSIRPGVSYKYGQWIMDLSVRMAMEKNVENIPPPIRSYERDDTLILFSISRKF